MDKKSKDYDKLEGTYQIIRLKRLEKMAFIPQIIGIIVVFAFFTYLGGAQLVPFYLPIYLPLLVISIWILVLSVEFFVFRLMEIRFRKSESAKFLMASRSMKGAYSALVVFGIICLLLFTPFLTQQIENYADMEGEITLTGSEDIYFTSQGRLDFIMAEHITVEVLEGDGTVDVAILHKEEERKLNRYSWDPQTASLDETFEYEMEQLPFDEYLLRMETDEPVTVRYTISQYIPDSRTYPFALISLGFFIAYAVFVGLMYPIKKKHADKAIYR
ncbi:MAG: hypothetical protein R6U17_02665 [Thermoplasmata archaeon]